MSDLRLPDGRVIHYDLRGPANADVIVLIEGLSAHMLGWRDGFCDLLGKAGYRVLRFDNRDVGLSSHYEGLDYGLADMADDVRDLLIGLGLRGAHLVGQSMGGMIAQRLVARNPELVRSLCLLYTTPSMRFVIDQRVQAPSTAQALTRDEAVAAHLESERWCASTAFSFDEEWKRHLGGLMYDRSFDPGGVARQRRAMDVADLDLDQLRAVAVPTLMIHGTADNLIDYEASRALADLIPGSHLLVIDGMGHDLPVELWPTITSAILRNIERVGDTSVAAIATTDQSLHDEVPSTHNKRMNS